MFVFRCYCCCRSSSLMCSLLTPHQKSIKLLSLYSSLDFLSHSVSLWVISSSNEVADKLEEASQTSRAIDNEKQQRERKQKIQSVRSTVMSRREKCQWQRKRAIHLRSRTLLCLRVTVIFLPFSSRNFFIHCFNLIFFRFPLLFFLSFKEKIILRKTFNWINNINGKFSTSIFSFYYYFSLVKLQLIVAHIFRPYSHTENESRNKVGTVMNTSLIMISSFGFLWFYFVFFCVFLFRVRGCRWIFFFFVILLCCMFTFMSLLITPIFAASSALTISFIFSLFLSRITVVELCRQPVSCSYSPLTNSQEKLLSASSDFFLLLRVYFSPLWQNSNFNSEKSDFFSLFWRRQK